MAVAAARQGARVAYVTAVGSDQFGDDFLTLWQGEGIDVSAVKRSAVAHTGLYFVTPRRGPRVFLHARRLGREPHHARRHAPRHDPRGEGDPRVGHQPGDLVVGRRCGLHRLPRGARCQGRGLLRHQPPPAPVAARSRPRRHPRRGEPRRHAQDQHRRRPRTHRSRRCRQGRRLLPRARAGDRDGDAR